MSDQKQKVSYLREREDQNVYQGCNLSLEDAQASKEKISATSLSLE